MCFFCKLREKNTVRGIKKVLKNYLIETIKNISSRASGKLLEKDKTVASKASWKLFGNANAIAAASPCSHSISVLMPLMHLHVNVYGRSMQSQVNN
jgi:hypothetical protein